MSLFGFGKKKENETKAPVCACNGGCSMSETVETESVNDCCSEAKDGICCIKVLGSGARLVMHFMKTHNPLLKRWDFLWK